MIDITLQESGLQKTRWQDRSTGGMWQVDKRPTLPCPEATMQQGSCTTRVPFSLEHCCTKPMSS